MAESNRKALLKPFQLIGISAVFGVFVMLILLLTLRDIVLGLIAGGATFIIAIVVLAMLVLSYRPNADVPVYLDRFQAASDEPGAADAALKVDPDAALSGNKTAFEEDPTGDAGEDSSASTDRPHAGNGGTGTSGGDDTATGGHRGDRPHH